MLGQINHIEYRVEERTVEKAFVGFEMASIAVLFYAKARPHLPVAVGPKWRAARCRGSASLLGGTELLATPREPLTVGDENDGDGDGEEREGLNMKENGQRMYAYLN